MLRAVYPTLLCVTENAEGGCFQYGSLTLSMPAARGAQAFEVYYILSLLVSFLLVSWHCSVVVILLETCEELPTSVVASAFNIHLSLRSS